MITRSFLAVLSLSLMCGMARADVLALPITQTQGLAYEPDVIWTAEGRMGNNGNSGDHEMNMGPSTSAPATQANMIWPNGAPVAFTLTYDTLSNTLSYTLGSNTLTYQPAAAAGSLMLRAAAYREGTSVVLSDMSLNGQSIPSLMDTPADGDAAWLLVTSSTLTDGFTLSGNATMSWAATMPLRSHLAFQFKGIDVPSSQIPEPATLGLLALGGAMLIRRR